MKHLISIHDLTPGEIDAIFERARDLKARKLQGEPHRLLDGQTLAMIFEKPSTRTRVSFETGMVQLGGHALVLNASDTQLGRGETIPDTARVLSRYVDGIMARTFAHDTVVQLAKYGSVPVVNGLTDLLHPCQALADYFTVRERFPDLEGVVVAYVGDGNNVAHSLMLGAAKLGLPIRVATPHGYEPDPHVVRLARADAAAFGGEVTLLEDPYEAVRGANVVYTDTWTSMGQEEEAVERRKVLAPYQVNPYLLAAARPEAIVLHCLPAHRGQEITDDVMDGPQSAVLDQAENRLHVEKAILVLLMGG
ncbi:MAG: ornithine carbamoyltransferase [Planctomycetota bacterium]